MTEPKLMFTVTEFCDYHGKIGKTLFYKMCQEGNGPRLVKVGRRTLITAEAAAEWRAKMDVEAANRESGK